MKMGTEASPDKKGGGHLFGYATCKAIQGTREKKTVFRCMEHNDDFVQITGLTSEQMERNEPVAALREMFGTSTDWDEIFNAVMEYGRCITLEKQTKTDKRIIQICLVSPDGRHLVIILWDGLAPEDTGQTKTFSEVDFASFFNHLTTGCAIYDVINDGATGNDYIFKDINKQGLVIEKKKKENIVGHPVKHIRPSVEKFGLISIFKHVFDTGEAQKMAPTHYQDHELDCWFENTVFKLPSGRIATLYQDVSDLISIQSELKESRDELDAYIQKAPIGIVILDGKGNLIDVNKTGCVYTGLKREELLQMNMTQWMQAIQNAKAVKSIKDMLFKGSIDTVITLKLPSKKEESAFSVRGVKVGPNRFIGFIVDVTQIKKLDEKLQANRDLLRHYFEKAPVCIFVFDEEGKIIDSNEWATQLLGYSKHAFLRMHIIDLMSKHRLHHAEECFSALRNNGSVTCEQVFYTSKNTEVIISINGVKLSGDRYIVFGSDITEQKRLQAKMAASEAEYRALFNHAGSGIVYIKPDGRIIWCNQSAARDLGQSSESLEGRSIFEVFPADIIDKYRKRLNDVIEAGHTVEYEDRVMMADGWRWFKVNQSCIYDSSRELRGIEIIFHDITDIKMSEYKIAESEKKFRNLFENAPTGNQSLDEEGRILDVNKKWLEMLGYDRDEVIGKPFTDFLAPNDAAQFMDFFKIYMKKGHMRKRFEMVKKNGDSIVVEKNGSITFDERGRFILTNGSLVNITEKEAAERRIIDSERRYRTIFNQTAFGISSLGPDGRYIQVNEKFCDMVGYTQEELLKMTFLDITYPEDREESRAKFEHAMHTKIDDTSQYEKRYIRKDGSVIYVQISNTFLRDDDGVPVHTVASIRDITERKHIEAENKRIEARLTEQQRLESIGILAGGVAHEINNPVNGIMNYSQLILDDDTSGPDVREYADEIIRESRRVSYIVRNLLRFSRQEIEQFAEIGVSEIVDQTLSLIRTLIRHDNISLSVDIPNHLPMIQCRSQQIQQVVMNLMTNARDALNERYPERDKDKVLKISAEQIEEPELNGIRIVVEDHGIGVSEEIRARIFNPFFTTKGRDKGTGLGLAISHRIVMDHSGRFDVESKPGEYTKFYVDLPYQPNKYDIGKAK